MKRIILIFLVVSFYSCEKLDVLDTFLTPVALEATNLTSNSFVAKWTRSPEVLGYKIQVAIDVNFDQIIKTLTVEGGTAFEITNLYLNQEYFYRVRAEYGAYEAEEQKKSKYSNIISVIFP